MDPLVSVVVPVYNKADYLAETLNSVLQQTFTHWECIVVNDGSTDDSLKIGREFCKIDPRIICIDISNSGVCHARNVGIKNAKGKYIFPLDADDLIERTCLEKMVSVIENNSHVKLVHCEVEMFGAEEGKLDLSPFKYPDMLYANSIVNSALFFKKDFVEVGGYRENMIYGLEDWDFWIALLKDCNAEQVVKIKEPLFKYRVTESSRRLNVIKENKLLLMTDTIVYNNFSLYQQYYPGVLNRLVKYDYHVKMLSKSPVKEIVWLMHFLSGMKTKFKQK